MLSLVIPTLNAAAVLPRALEAGGSADEVVVVDGGSTDATAEVARANGARLVSSPPGRGRQLAAGARAAAGDWLLFLHADTRLAVDWRAKADAFMARTGDTPLAAVFRFTLDDPSAAARRVERLAAWRTRVLGLPYGDQGLLIARAFYDSLGGFRPLPLMEDVDMIRRIGRERIVVLESLAMTSAARYRHGGWWLRPARNTAILALYFAGVPPRILARLYG